MKRTKRNRGTKEEVALKEFQHAMKGIKKTKRRLFSAILKHCMDVLGSRKESANRKDRICRFALPYVAHKVTDPKRLTLAERKIKHRERIRDKNADRGSVKAGRKAAAEAATKKKTGKWGNLLAGAGVERGKDIEV